MRLYAKVDRHNAVKLIAHAPASKWNGGPVSSRGLLEAAALTAGHLPGEQKSLRRYMGGPVRFANGVGAVRSGVMRTSGRFWRPKWITGHLRVPGGSLGLPQPPGMGLGRFGGVWCDSPDRENKTIFG